VVRRTDFADLSFSGTKRRRISPVRLAERFFTCAESLLNVVGGCPEQGRSGLRFRMIPGIFTAVKRSTHLCLTGGRIEIAGAVSLDEPLILGAPALVHPLAALYRGPGFNILHPPEHMRVRTHLQKLGRFISIVGH